MSIMLSASWSRIPREAISPAQHGRVIGFDPAPPIHAVDNLLAETDRVTLCGIDATQMYLWTLTFANTHPSDRCIECEAHFQQAAAESAG